MVNAGTSRNRQKHSTRKAVNKEHLLEKNAPVSKNSNYVLIMAVVGAACLIVIGLKTDIFSSWTRQKDVSENRKEHKSQEKQNLIKALTNRFDRTISKELNKAQKLLDQGHADKALQEFSFLAAKYKNSPRSRYGKAQALDKSADRDRSNSLVLDAINVYKEVADIDGCPDELKRVSLKRMANRLQFLGKHNRAARVYELLSVIFPDDVEAVNDLGIEFLHVGDNNRALTTFQKALKISPTNGCAQSHIGFILKGQDKLNESIPYLEKGLKSGDERSEQGNFYYHLGDAYERLGNRNAARRVYETGTERGYFMSAMQRSLYNADTKLKAQPWWTLKETGYVKDLAKLESNWQIIRDEAVSLLSEKDSGGFEKEAEKLQDVGDWRQLTLYSKGQKDFAGCHRAPKTCEIVRNMPAASGCTRGQIKFSVMHPGTHVWPHCGPTNCRLRVHLGLVIPDNVFITAGGKTRTWQEGKVLVFDDSFEHEVWHNGTSFRLILIIDFWHPDLTQRQRQELNPI